MTSTTATRRVQRSRARGSKLEPGAICCTRPHWAANPHKIDPALPDRAAEQRRVVELYREDLRNDPALVERIRRELAGCVLACWCRPELPCHVDVLLAVASGGAP